jgi:hypothetical protein
LKESGVAMSSSAVLDQLGALEKVLAGLRLDPSSDSGSSQRVVLERIAALREEIREGEAGKTPVKRARVVGETAAAAAAADSGSKEEHLRLLVGDKLFSLPVSLFGEQATEEVKNSFLAMLLSGRIPSEKDPSTSAFVLHNRSAEVFPAILSYIRTGSVPLRFRWEAKFRVRVALASAGGAPDESELGASQEELETLSAEADFFLLPGIIPQVVGGAEFRDVQVC